MPKRITEQDYSEYEKLLKKYQQMRRKIIKAHKNIAEQSHSYSRLPQLVAPERETKISIKKFRLTSRRIFNLKLRQLKKLVYGGYEGFYKEFKAQYLKLYQSLLDEEPELNPFGAGKGFLYSEYQMKTASKEEAQFMKDYNNLVRMNPMVFAYLIKTGRIPEFKKLYAQFQGEVRTQENWLDSLSKAIKMSRYFKPSEAEEVLTASNFSKANAELLQRYLNKYEK